MVSPVGTAGARDRPYPALCLTPDMPRPGIIGMRGLMISFRRPYVILVPLPPRPPAKALPGMVCGILLLHNTASTAAGPAKLGDPTQDCRTCFVQGD